MLRLFLQLVDSIALEGEGGASVEQLFLEHNISDNATQNYLLQVLRKDPRTDVSEDGKRVVASKDERRRALGAALLDGQEHEDASMEILSFVARRRGKGRLSTELETEYKKRAAFQVERLVVLGLLVKKIVVLRSPKLLRTNLYLLPRFERQLDPAALDLTVEWGEAERAQYYDSLVDQIRRLGTNIVVANKLRLDGVNLQKKPGQTIRRIVGREERRDVPVLRVLSRADLPADLSIPRHANVFLELVEREAPEQAEAASASAAEGAGPVLQRGVMMNANFEQLINREVDNASRQGVSAGDLVQTLGVDPKRAFRAVTDMITKFKQPCQKFQEGRQQTHKLFPRSLLETAPEGSSTKVPPSALATTLPDASAPVEPSPGEEVPTQTRSAESGPAEPLTEANAPVPADQPTETATAAEPAGRQPRSFGHLVGELTSDVEDSRRAFLIAHVREAGGVALQSDAASALKESERVAGLQFKIDTRTLRRLIGRMHEEQQLRVIQVEVAGDLADLLVDASLADPDAAVDSFIRQMAEEKRRKEEKEAEADYESDEDSGRSSVYSVYSDDSTERSVRVRRKRKLSTGSVDAAENFMPITSGTQLQPFAAAVVFHARLIDLLRVNSAYELVLNMSFSLGGVLNSLRLTEWTALFGCPDQLRNTLSERQSQFGILKQQSPTLAEQLLQSTISAIHRVLSILIVAGVLQPPPQLASYFPRQPPDDFDTSAGFLSQPFSLQLQADFGAGTFSLRSSTELKNFWTVVSRSLKNPENATHSNQVEVVTTLRALLPNDDNFDVVIADESLPPPEQRRGRTSTSSASKPKSKSGRKKKRKSFPEESDAPTMLWSALGITSAEELHKRRQSQKQGSTPLDNDESKQSLHNKSTSNTSVDRSNNITDASFEVGDDTGHLTFEQDDDEGEDEVAQGRQRARSDSGGVADAQDGFSPRDDWRLLEAFLARFLRLDPVYAPPAVLQQDEGGERLGEHNASVDGLSTILQRDFRWLDLSTLPRYTPRAVLDELGRPAPQCYRRLGVLLRKFRTPIKVAAYLLASGGLSKDVAEMLNTILDEEQMSRRRAEVVSPTDEAALSRVLQVLTDNEGKQLPSVMAKLMDFEPRHIVRVFRELWCRGWLQQTHTADQSGKKQRRLDLSDAFYTALSGPYSAAYRFVDQSEDLLKDETEEAEGLLQADQLMKCVHRMANDGVQYGIDVARGEVAVDEDNPGIVEDMTGTDEEVVGGKLTGFIAPQLNRLKVRVRVEEGLNAPAPLPRQANDFDPPDCPWVTVHGRLNEEFLSALRLQVLSTLTSHPGSSAAQIKASVPNISSRHCDLLLSRLVAEGMIEARTAPASTDAIRRNPFSSLTDLVAHASSMGSASRSSSYEATVAEPAEPRYWIRLDKF